MATTNETILSLIFQVSGQEGVDKVAAALKGAGDAGEKASPEIQAAADALAKLVNQNQSLESFSALQAKLTQTAAQLEAARANLSALNSEFDRSDKSSSAVNDAFAAAEASVKSLSTQHAKLSAQVAATGSTLQAQGVDVTNLGAAHDALAVKLKTASTNLVDVAAKAQAGSGFLNTLKAAADKTGESFKSVGEFVLEAGKKVAEFTGIAGLLTAAFAAITGFKFFEEGAKDAATFDAALAKLRATTGATGEALDELAETAEAAGKATNTSASQSVNVLAALAAQLGSTQAATAALTPTLTLAKAAQIDLADATNIVSESIKAFNLPASDAGQVVDQLAAVALKTGANLGALTSSFGQLEPQAKQLGLSFSDTVDLLGLLSTKGINAETATRSLKTAFTDLNTPSSELAQKLAGLGISTGSLSGAIDGLVQAGPRGIQALQSLGAKGQNALLALVQAGVGGLAKFQQSLGDTAGQAEKTAKTIEDSVGPQLENFGRDLDQLAGKAVAGAIPAITAELEKLDAQLKTASDTPAFARIKQAITDFVTVGVQKIDEFLQKFDFAAAEAKLADFLTSSKSSLGGVGDAFRDVGKVFSTIGTTIALAINSIKTVFNAFAASTSDIFNVLGKISSTLAPLYVKLGLLSQQQADQLKELQQQYSKNAKDFSDATDASAQAAIQNLKDLDSQTASTGNTAALAATKHEQHAKGLSDSALAAENAKRAEQGLAPLLSDTSASLDAGAAAADKHAKALAGTAAGAQTAGAGQRDFAAELKKSNQDVLDAGDALEELRVTFKATPEAVAAAKQKILDAAKSYADLKESARLAGVTIGFDLTQALQAANANLQKIPPTAGDVKAAFNGLHIQSQQTLQDLARDYASYFATVDSVSDNSAKGMADRRAAFLALAQAVLAANQNLDDSARDQAERELESKAAVLGVTDALKKLEDASNKAHDSVVDNVGNQTDALIKQLNEAGSAGQNAGQKIADGADKAADSVGQVEKRVEDTTGKIPSFAQEMTNAMESVRSQFVQTSDAAAKFFDTIFQGDLENQGILKQTSESAQTLGQHLANLREDAAEDIVGITKFYYALESAQAATNDKITEQRANLKDLIAGYTNLGEQGGQALTVLGGTGISSLKNLEQMDAALKAGTYDAGLLGQEELQPLQTAIEAAISKTQALADAAKQAQQQFIDLGSQLQDDLDTAAGNDEAVEDRRYQQQLANLKAAAQAAGQLNSQQYQQDVANANALHALKLKQIEQEAAAAKASASGSGSSASGSSASSGDSSGSQGGGAAVSSGSSSGSGAGPASASAGVTHVYNLSPTFYGGGTDQFDQFVRQVKQVLDRYAKLSK